MPGSEYGDIPFADDIKVLIDTLETTINTLITGLETIIDDVKTSIEAVNTTIASLKTELAEYDFKGLYKQWNFIASDTLIKSDDVEESHHGALTKLKEFTFNPTNGSSINATVFRFKWKQKQNLSFTHKTQIRKNGAAWGALKSTTYGTGWDQFSEDLTGAVDGDTLELWVQADESTTYVKDYRCYGDAVLIEYDDPIWS